MTQNARGLFRATGKTSKAVADLVDGELVKTADPARNALDFYPTPSEPTLALLRAEHFRLCELGGKIWELREQAKLRHPDAPGGSHAQMTELNAAMEECERELTNGR